jgi:hypothetical protein
MSSYGQMEVTISPTHILFNKTCVNKMRCNRKIEILINPYEKKMAVRRASNESRQAMEWSRTKDGQVLPKIISGAAFLPTIFELLGWEENCQYKILGYARGKGDERILLFDLKEAVLLFVQDEEEFLDESNQKKRIRRVRAYPSQWAESFGENYYETEAVSNHESSKDISAGNTEEDLVYSLEKEKVTTQEEAAAKLGQILRKMGVEND